MTGVQTCALPISSTKHASPSLEATMEAEKAMELFKISSSKGGDERVEHGIFPFDHGGDI